MKMTLKYIASDVDAQGNVRHYVRKAGRPKIRLRARPGTVDFMLEYERALSGVDARQVKPKPARERAEGTRGPVAAGPLGPRNVVGGQAAATRPPTRRAVPPGPRRAAPGALQAPDRTRRGTGRGGVRGDRCA